MLKIIFVWFCYFFGIWTYGSYAQESKKSNKTDAIVGFGYSIEILHAGVRYNFSPSYDLGAYIGGFGIAGSMSLGIEQRYLFVQSKKSERKSFFILQSFTLFNDGLGSEPGDTGIFFSISIGKNFHFNEHSGLALDLGADISLSDTWDSLLGPRLQFYF